MTINHAFYQLRNLLRTLYAEAEATAIAHWVLEDLTGQSKIERLLNKDQLLSPMQQNSWTYMVDELLSGKPIQYVLGKSYFMEQELIVDTHVLIPRPETEELVMWILQDWGTPKQVYHILDIGTGSGCIPITLKKEMPECIVEAGDISVGALHVAKKNAQKLGQNVHFFEFNVLDNKQWQELAQYDLITSNPPYIPIAERALMEKNVRDFEPHLALFVADSDRFLFYRAIAQLGKTKLKEGGAIYCEIHRDYPEETKAVFESEGYRIIELRKDMHDNWRMIKAQV